MDLDTIRGWVLRRRQAYRAIFTDAGGVPNQAAHVVLSDLRTFCRATTTPAVVSPITQTLDPIATGIAIGRLEVWHRITQNINLSDTDLYKLVDRQESGDQVG